MKKYSWRLDVWHTIDADDVGKELEKIEKTTGVTNKNVLEYAKNEDSVLHKMFEWDDTIAGEKYRLEQARQIIANIQVEYIKKDNSKTQIRAFVKTTQKHEEYRSIESVVSDEEQYALLLNQAYKDLNITKNKYAELQEIQELLKDIPEIL